MKSTKVLTLGTVKPVYAYAHRCISMHAHSYLSWVTQRSCSYMYTCMRLLCKHVRIVHNHTFTINHGSLLPNSYIRG